MSHDCGTAQQQKGHCMRVDVRLWPVRHPRMRRSGVGEAWVGNASHGAVGVGRNRSVCVCGGGVCDVRRCSTRVGGGRGVRGGMC